MSKIISRIPLINWEEGFSIHWFDENPVLTHVFNALSFLFPEGERYFMRISRDVYNRKNLKQNDDLEKMFKLFIRQESAHFRQHEKYNSILEQQGFKNTAHNYLFWFETQTDRLFSPVNSLAIVCAYEHFTAIIGDFILSNQDLFNKAEGKLALLWGWHGAEETEHKSVCFDLYCASGGSFFMRFCLFLLICFNFLFMFSLNLFSLLWQDNCFHPRQFFSTILNLIIFFWGINGVGWLFIRQGIRYCNPYFYPWKNNNNDKLERWLKANKSKLKEFEPKAI